jgi:DNA-binding MarR family transcriptional regulator
LFPIRLALWTCHASYFILFSLLGTLIFLILLTNEKFSAKLNDVATKQRPLSVLVWLRLIRIMQKVSRAATEPMQKADLSGPQLDVLATVDSAEGLTQQELADQLHVTKGNVTQLIDKLEKKGLLKRQKEGRISKIFLTTKGADLVTRLLPEHDRFIVEQFAGLNADEQQQLLSLLRKLERS